MMLLAAGGSGGGGGVMSNHSYTASFGRGGLVDGDRHVVKEATSTRWDAHTGKHLWTGIRWAWRTLGKALWFAGDGGGGGESHLLAARPPSSPTSRQ